MPELTVLEPGDPSRLGPYTLVGRLGEGGFGVVYLAEGPSGERVALKLMQGRLAGDAVERERFAREVAAARQVARFCTAQVLDADVVGDRPYIVSEYVDGASLDRLVAEHGLLGGGALERLAIGTATALAAIHQAGIVHRDFKPQNVLLGPDGPRVIDFGIARMLGAAATASSRVVGTPAYMSPEQVAGEAIGPATDVFAWASTLVFAASAAAPFGHDSIPAVLNRIIHHDPDLGRLSGELRELAAACLAKDPGARPSARELLLRLLGHDDAGGRRAARANDGQSALLAEGVTQVARLDPTLPTAQLTGHPAAPAAPAAATASPEAAAGGTGGISAAPADPAASPVARQRRTRLIVGSVAAGLALVSAVALAGYRLGQGDVPTAGRQPPAAGSGSGQAGTSGATPESVAEEQTVPPQSGRPKLTVSPARIKLDQAHAAKVITLTASGGPVRWTATATGPVRLTPRSGTAQPGAPSGISIDTEEISWQGATVTIKTDRGTFHTVKVDGP